MYKSILGAACFSALPAIGSDLPKNNPQKPNIVFILADDLGYGEISALHVNPVKGKIATPHVDRLISESITFTDAHSDSAVCTPSRYGLLTGRYAWRKRLQSGVVTGHAPCLISEQTLTVADILREAGYSTGLPDIQLYDMDTGIEEQFNLQAKHPEVVRSLVGLMTDIVADGRSTPGKKLKNDIDNIDTWKRITPISLKPLADAWIIDSQEDWQSNIALKSNLDITRGRVVPTDTEATFQSSVKKFSKKRSVSSITLSQSPEWLNWKPVSKIGPSNLGDAPVALQLGDGNYWMFGRYGKRKSQIEGTFQREDTTLEGFDIPLKTTPFKNQFDAPGGLKPGLGGYHAWQSRDMVNWVHHGPVSERFSIWVTTAEYADGKLYLYYDFPNDQNPHLYIDEDLTDGVPGKNMGMAFKDPSDGSDCAVIRDLEGNFHLILEDWSPINASTHAWDSPLAVHAVSPDGINNFEILDPPVDERTNPTGKFAKYAHPHWHAEDPENYPVKAGENRAFAKYEIHEPEQNAYGDWAAISIGGQYYLFCDFHPAGRHGGQNMSVAWFTSNDINKQFTFCGNIGQGHPDPDVMFAEGQFYLLTQTDTDYISPGPWVESVKVRMGVDTTNDGLINQWSDWQVVAEQYDYMEGFAKQIERIPAKMDLSGLPEGYGFQFEVKITDTTENESKPILDKVVVNFDK